MKRTKTPVAEGIYLVRWKGLMTVDAVRLAIGHDGLFICGSTDSDENADVDDVAEWYGPITPPPLEGDDEEAERGAMALHAEHEKLPSRVLGCEWDELRDYEQDAYRNALRAILVAVRGGR